MDRRSIRRKGEILHLGEMDCRIEGLEGRGGSSIVYRAVYQDSLSSGRLHHVLIKELYPWTPDNAIYRGEDGSICCTENGKELLRSSEESFLDGNEANLTLLEQMPERTSGNLNSFRAYGTFYSVLTLHGGENLQRMLEAREREGGCSLRESAEILIQILDALECFHSCGLLHLDLSPDNVLMLKTHALLIDYNSVFRMDGTTEMIRFSEKEGYTPPEVRLREISRIGPCSDLYSAAAILFRMLTGRNLTNEDVLGNHPAAGLTPDLPAFRGEPASACAKMMQIVRRGLHVLPRKRCQSTGEMRRDLEEVLLRLDRKGVTFASLWEGSRAEYRAATAGRGPFLDRSIRLLQADGQTGPVCSEEELSGRLAGGDHLLLSGIGGMGKTCLLEKLWGSMGRTYSEKSSAVFYIPLSGYQESGQETFYIRKYLLRQLNLADVSSMEAALQELNRLLDPDRRHRWVFLLDGLKEAGTHSEHLLQEIEDLGRIPGIGILVTDRTADVKRYALKDFTEAELQPLSEETVRRNLLSSGLRVPEDAALFRSLTNPMMLALYRQIRELRGDTSGTDDREDTCESMQGMIDRYMEALCTRELRKDSGNPADQLRHTYLLQHLLPEIARQMERKGRNLLTQKELADVLAEDFTRLRGRELSAVFPEYMGKSRLMLEGIANGQEWYDYAVSEQLVGHFGLLQQTREGGFCCVHDNFMECLAVHGEEHHRAFRRNRRRRMALRVAIAAAAAAIAAVILYLVLPHRLSGEEKTLFRNASEQLEMNTSIVNVQLMWLDAALEEAQDPDVLEGEDGAIEAAQKSISYALQQTSRQLSLYYIEEDAYIAELKTRYSADAPSTAMTELLYAPVLMQDFLLQKLDVLYDQLEEGTEDEILESVEVLTEYMDAYTVWYYLEFSSVLLAFGELGAEDAAAELIEYMNDSGSEFTECITWYGLGTITQEKLETALSTAQDQLDRTEARVNIYLAE